MTTLDNGFIQKKIHNYICNICDYKCFRKRDYEKHIETIKHKNMEKTTLDNGFIQKKIHIFECNICDYNCFTKRDYEKHVETKKHKNMEKTTLDNGFIQKSQISPQISPIIKKFFCENCNKEYNDRAGLWRHKKKCEQINTQENNEEIKNVGINELVNYLIKENTELRKEIKTIVTEQQNMIMKVLENGTHNTTNNNNNCHNKTFNLQVFLNEQCKDALNISEFIDSLKISFSDIENIGENGFVNGISKIFLNGLKSLDVYKRPIHCSDLKRETMHIKEQNVWEKDNENNDRLKKAVKLIAHKNMLKINDWKNAYPQCKDSASKKNDQYLKMLICTAGPTNKEDELSEYKKIIRNIAKEVVIDK